MKMLNLWRFSTNLGVLGKVDPQMKVFIYKIPWIMSVTPPCLPFATFRSSHPEVFLEKGVYRKSHMPKCDFIKVA